MLGSGIKEDRPSYVRFERRPVEDRNASIAAGHYVTKDVDFAVVTPVGSKDQIAREAAAWLLHMETQVREERLPAAWLEKYKEAYALWRKGEEIPLHGVPIKGWQVLGPAHQSNVIAANILTVEDLAQVNDEGLRRIGMGAVEMRDKAVAWLKGAAGPGKFAQEMSAMQAQIRALTSSNEALAEQNKELKSQITGFLAQNRAEVTT